MRLVRYSTLHQSAGRGGRRTPRQAGRTVPAIRRPPDRGPQGSRRGAKPTHSRVEAWRRRPGQRPKRSGTVPWLTSFSVSRFLSPGSGQRRRASSSSLSRGPWGTQFTLIEAMSNQNADPGLSTPDDSSTSRRELGSTPQVVRKNSHCPWTDLPIKACPACPAYLCKD